MRGSAGLVRRHRCERQSITPAARPRHQLDG